MSVLDWFRGLGRQKAPAATGAVSNGGGGLAALLPVENVSPGVDLSNYLEALVVSPWVHRCVTTIAQACASVPLELRDASDNIITSHPLLRLLEFVNARDNYPYLCAATIGYTHLAGNAYWMLDDANRPNAIYALRPDRVEIKPAKRGPVAYEYKASATQAEGQKLKDEEVIHFRTWHPTNDYYGLPTLRSIETTINTDKHVREFNDHFLQNSATPSGILRTPPGTVIPQQQREQMIREFNASYMGAKSSGKTMLLGDGIEWQAMGEGLKDSKFQTLSALMREEILALFGVPPVVVGLLDGATYANSREQKRIFWEDTILGHNLAQYVGRLNEDLVPRYGDGLRLVPDISAIEAIQEQQTDKYQRVSAAVGMPFLTPNEARIEVGLEPVGDEGDTIYVSPTLVPLGTEPPPRMVLPGGPPPGGEEAVPPGGETASAEGAAGAAGAEPAAEATPAKGVVRPFVHRAKGVSRFGEYGSHEHVVYWKRWVNAFTDIERQAQHVASDLYLQALDEVIARLDRQKHYKATQPDVERILLDVFTDELGREWVTALTAPIRAALELGAAQALADMGVDSAAWSVTNPRVTEYLDTKRLLIRTIPETQFGQLRDVLTGAQAEGATIGDMVSQLQELNPQYRYYQAERVARTETMGAANRGTLDTFTELAVQEKEWLSAIDERTRDAHVAANGQVVPVDEPFTVDGEELMHPGDSGGSAGNIINCRCTMVASENG